MNVCRPCCRLQAAIRVQGHHRGKPRGIWALGPINARIILLDTSITKKLTKKLHMKPAGCGFAKRLQHTWLHHSQKLQPGLAMQRL